MLNVKKRAKMFALSVGSNLLQEMDAICCKKLLSVFFGGKSYFRIIYLLCSLESLD